MLNPGTASLRLSPWRSVTDGLEAWKAAVAPDNKAPRFADTVKVANNTVTAIGQALAQFGIKDAGESRWGGKAK